MSIFISHHSGPGRGAVRQHTWRASDQAPPPDPAARTPLFKRRRGRATQPHTTGRRHEPDLRRPPDHRLRGHVAARPRDRAVNLGQGFPDDPGPEDVRRKAAEAVVVGLEPVSADDGPARAARAPSPRITRISRASSLDPDGEVMVTSGATEALAGALLALIEPGDEVVLFQPMYDAYLPLVRRAGGVPRFVTLRPPALPAHRGGARGAPSRRARRSSCSTIRSTRPASVFRDEDLALLGRVLPALRRRRGLRRGLGARRLRRPPRIVPLMALPGHARAHGEDRLGRQDLLADRLEGRLRLRRADAHAGARQGAPVPHLHDAAEPAGRRRLRARQGRRLFRGPARATSQRSRDRFASGLDRARLRRPPERRAPTSSTSTSRPSARRDDVAFCRRLVARARRRRDSGLGLLRRGRGEQRGRASASPRPTRRSTPRSSGSRGCARQAA